jgi:uncharacterized protein (DUF2236 family)
MTFVQETTFGDTATAEAACARVRKVHEHISGTDPVTGLEYSASAPDLLAWIHAVEVHSFVVAYRAYAGRLSDGDADRYVAEMARVAELVELPSHLAPRTFGALEDYLDGMRASLRMTEPARDGLRTILAPPMRPALRPLWTVPGIATIAVLPDWARRMYGLRWVPAATLPIRVNVHVLSRAMNVLLPRAPVVREARARVGRAA